MVCCPLCVHRWYTMNITGNITTGNESTNQPLMHEILPINWLPQLNPHCARPGLCLRSPPPLVNIVCAASYLSFGQTYFWTTIICIIPAQRKENMAYVTMQTGLLQQSLRSISRAPPPPINCGSPLLTLYKLQLVGLRVLPLTDNGN